MNAERWLISYADFITLLFAFFVVMFASSQVDKKKMAVYAATFDAYVNRRGAAPALTPPGDGRQTMTVKPSGGSPELAARALSMAQLAPSQQALAGVLAEEILAGKVELSLQPRGLVLSLKESAFFPPGQDTMEPEARRILGKVTEALLKIPGQIRLEGHTDETPIHTRRFPSNWQLSTARSIAVLKMLTADFGFPAERLAVAGYGEYHPLQSNLGGPGRARNRRVDLVILTQEAAAMGPG